MDQSHHQQRKVAENSTSSNHLIAVLEENTDVPVLKPQS